MCLTDGCCPLRVYVCPSMSVVLNWGHSATQGHLATSGDIFVVTSCRWVLVTSSRWGRDAAQHPQGPGWPPPE